MWVAISTGGVYRSDDGGQSWRPRNHGARADFLPDKQPEFGQCVHKVVLQSTRTDRLFLQNHWGLYRSDDGGDSWQDVAHGVPSDFGFAMAAHPTTRTPATSFHSSQTSFAAPPAAGCASIALAMPAGPGRE